MESGHTVEWASEDNYMFRLSAFQDRLLEWIDSKPYRTFFSLYSTVGLLNRNLRTVYGSRGLLLSMPTVYSMKAVGFTLFLLVTFPAIIPESSRQRVHYWLLNESNSDLSVSRPRSRLQWGVPIPNDSSQTVCSEKRNYRTSKKMFSFLADICVVRCSCQLSHCFKSSHLTPFTHTRISQLTHMQSVQITWISVASDQSDCGKGHPSIPCHLLACLSHGCTTTITTTNN